jgi:hypothetical protein
MAIELMRAVKSARKIARITAATNSGGRFITLLQARLGGAGMFLIW